MVKSINWCRKTTWSPSDHRDFFDHLARAKIPNRAQYIRIQASHLGSAGLYTDAIELLDLMFREYPENAQLAIAHLQKAGCLSALEKVNEAIDEYRAVIKQEQIFPTSLTDGYLDFPWFIVTRELKTLYSEASKVLELPDRRLMFPINHYRFHAIHAILAEAFEDGAKACGHAKSALEAAVRTESGFRYHKGLGLVHDVNATIHGRLVRLSGTR